MASGNANIWLDNIFMRGGFGPDTSPIGTQSYDYRYRNYDPRVGVKSNPSDVQSGRFVVDPLRQAVTLDPVAYGDPNIRQQFFRRGGALVQNWYFLGTNISDGGLYTDILTDDQIKAADILEFNNDKPVTTLDSSGATIYAQPLPSIWGPVLDLLMGCGDPHQPGVVFWSKQGEYDHWPVANSAEACAPSEELMAGCVFLGQGYVFSRLRCFNCYVNLQGGGVVVPTPTACKHGLASRWGLSVCQDGIYFVSYDGIYVTTGSTETSITDDDLFAIFHGEARHGYSPVDLTHPEAIKLDSFQNELYFQYQDTQGTNQVLVYSLVYKFWRHYGFGREISSLFAETGLNTEVPQLLLGGRSSSVGYTHSGTSDDGLAISGQIRTGTLDQGFPRQDKLYGDLVFETDPKGNTLTLTPYANFESATLTAQNFTGASRARTYLDPIDGSGNPGPYLARNLSLDLTWSTILPPPKVFQFGTSSISQPDDVIARVTDWDSAGTLGMKWVKGVVLEVDTQGAAKSVTVEADGVAQQVISVLAAGRLSLEFSWPEFRGQLLRLRPTGSGLIKIYSSHWIFDEEPLCLARWETQEIDYKLNSPGGFSLFYANIVLRSTADVTIQVTKTRNDGSMFTMSSVIPSTSDQKQQIFVPFPPNKGVFSRWLFTSAIPFYLYREESDVAIQPWAGNLTSLHPFGNDDLDLVRSMANATGTAAVRQAGYR
jgi:hypothetical protein